MNEQPTANRPKLLYLVHRVPYPPNRGDRIRSYHLLRYLAQRFDIYLATLADEEISDETRVALSELCRQVAIAPVRGLSRWIRAATSMLGGRTATEGLFQHPHLRREIGQWTRSVRFDAALVFCSSMFQYLEGVDLPSERVLVDLVDVDSQKWFDYAASVRGPKRWLFQCEGSRLRRLESSLAERVGAITLVSEHEADLYRSFCPNQRTYGVPNGVDIDYFAATDRMRWSPDTPESGADASSTASPATDLVFVGALDYRANIDGLIWFCSEVWPLVQEAVPDATLQLVGRCPPAEIRALSAVQGVQVIGTVPDVRPYLARSKASIAPLRVARGIQNKVLEAMAAGTPVIASLQAAEGLSVRDGEHLMVASSPQQWRDAIVQLLQEGPLRTRLAENGRRHVIANHRWNATLAALDELLPA